MTDTQTFRLEDTCNSDAPDDYKQRVWENMKREMGLKLYGLLEQQKIPVVVEIFENIKQFPAKDYETWSYFNQRNLSIGRLEGYDKLRIEVRFTPVKYRHVEYQVTPSMLDYLRNYEPPIIEKFKMKLKALYNKLAL